MSNLRGLFTTVVLLGNLVLWATPVTLVGLFKALIPKSDFRNRTILFAVWLGEQWVGINNRIADLLMPVRWRVELPQLNRTGHYLIIANHQSGVDIPVLQRIFHQRVPFLRFFAKRSLLFVPVLGPALWAVEFPFMRRYSAEYLEKHPGKREEDIATTRRSCRRYLRMPVSILNFIEGTRFSRDKQGENNSPYRHLLRPRVGGIAHTLAVMGDQLKHVLDVTIAFDHPEPTVWNWVCGRVREIRVMVQEIDVPAEFRSASVTEPGPHRERFKLWINELWAQKDEVLEQAKREMAAPALPE